MNRFLLVLLLLTACSGASSDDLDDDETSEGALAERWTSPIRPGHYDAADATVTVREGIQDQDATYDAASDFIYGGISVSDGRATFIDRTDKKRAVVLTPAGANVDVVRRDSRAEGAPVRFVRRAPNALQGTYVNAAGRSITVEASDDASITFTLGGARVRAKLHDYFIDWPNRYAPDDRPAVFPEGCFLVVKRSAGRTFLQVGGNTTCPLGDYLAR